MRRRVTDSRDLTPPPLPPLPRRRTTINQMRANLAAAKKVRTEGQKQSTAYFPL